MKDSITHARSLQMQIGLRRTKDRVQVTREPVAVLIFAIKISLDYFFVEYKKSYIFTANYDYVFVEKTDTLT